MIFFFWRQCHVSWSELVWLLMIAITLRFENVIQVLIVTDIYAQIEGIIHNFHAIPSRGDFVDYTKFCKLPWLVWLPLIFRKLLTLLVRFSFSKHYQKKQNKTKQNKQKNKNNSEKSFIKWIDSLMRTFNLYNRLSSFPFCLSRGISHGDPIWPFPFIFGCCNETRLR